MSLNPRLAAPKVGPPGRRGLLKQFSTIQQNVEGFIRGKSCSGTARARLHDGRGHLLIDDIPGVGKTSLAKAIANSISGSMTASSSLPTCSPQT